MVWAYIQVHILSAVEDIITTISQTNLLEAIMMRLSIRRFLKHFKIRFEPNSVAYN